MQERVHGQKTLPVIYYKSDVMGFNLYKMFRNVKISLTFFRLIASVQLHSTVNSIELVIMIHYITVYMRGI